MSKQPPSLESAGTIGAILRATREFHGLALEDLAEATRIRPHYLAAIEEMRVSQLPSRPFTLGYVRAYAEALGVDPEAAVARFKSDAPEDAEPLRAPVGVRREGDPRLMLIGVAGAVVVAGVVLWNVAQRAVIADTAQVQSTALVAASGGASSGQSAPLAHPVPPPGPVSLGAPLPAPPESTTPKPYITPGLPPPSSAPGAPSEADAAMADEDDAPPPVFTPHGTVYGAQSESAPVVLQAKHPTVLVVHGPDGSVYFARQLAAGEAYRAPLVGGLSFDVSDPTAFDVYVAGAFKGALPSAKVAVSALMQ